MELQILEWNLKILDYGTLASSIFSEQEFSWISKWSWYTKLNIP